MVVGVDVGGVVVVIYIDGEGGVIGVCVLFISFGFYYWCEVELLGVFGCECYVN